MKWPSTLPDELKVAKLKADSVQFGESRAQNNNLKNSGMKLGLTM
jgi:hypothetical protein